MIYTMKCNKDEMRTLWEDRKSLQWLLQPFTIDLDVLLKPSFINILKDDSFVKIKHIWNIYGTIFIVNFTGKALVRRVFIISESAHISLTLRAARPSQVFGFEGARESLQLLSAGDERNLESSVARDTISLDYSTFTIAP